MKNFLISYVPMCVTTISAMLILDINVFTNSDIAIVFFGGICTTVSANAITSTLRLAFSK